MKSLDSSADGAGRIELSVAIVSYNTADSLVRCLESILHRTTTPLEVIVVDNDSCDASAERAREVSPRVSVVRNRTNRGFAAAVNQALRLARGEYFLMLNPDSVLLNQAVDSSLGFLRGSEDRVAMTCEVVGTEGRPNGRMRGPGYADLRAQLLMNLRLERFFRGSGVMRRALLDNFDYSTVADIDFAPGCFFLLSTEFLRQLGGLDEQFSLYGEDHDLCLRVHDAGGRILYYPGARVVHAGGESSGSIGLIAYEHRVANRYRVYVKHFGAAKAFGYSAVRCLGSLVDLIRAARSSLRARTMVDLATASHKAAFTILWFLRIRAARPLPQRQRRDS